jgi:hypothetical protein
MAFWHWVATAKVWTADDGRSYGDVQAYVDPTFLVQGQLFEGVVSRDLSSENDTNECLTLVEQWVRDFTQANSKLYGEALPVPAAPTPVQSLGVLIDKFASLAKEFYQVTSALDPTLTSATSAEQVASELPKYDQSAQEALSA